MITLNDVLASSRLHREGVVRTIGQEIAASAARRTVYQSFKESQEREETNAERSPVVLWAKRSLRGNPIRVNSQMTNAEMDQPQDSSF